MSARSPPSAIDAFPLAFAVAGGLDRLVHYQTIAEMHDCRRLSDDNRVRVITTTVRCPAVAR